MKLGQKLGIWQKCMLNNSLMRFIWKLLMEMLKFQSKRYLFSKIPLNMDLKICLDKRCSPMLQRKNSIFNKNCNIWVTPLTLCKNMKNSKIWGVPNLGGHTYWKKKTDQRKNGRNKLRSEGKTLRKGKR